MGGSLDLLDLFANDDGIILADLILAQFFVVELAVVFVGIAMLPAEQASTSAVEALKQQRKEVRLTLNE